MLELYHNNMSVCAQKVRLVLAEKQVETVEHHLDVRGGETHTPEYRALNPKGVVPTLVVDGVPIVESTIICEYLEDRFAQQPLLPSDALERSQVRQWTLRPDAGLHRACGLLSFALAFRFQNVGTQMATRKPSQSSSELLDVIAQGLDSPHIAPQIAAWRSMIDDMAARLSEHDWLAGTAYSLADIAMLPYVCRLDDLGQNWIWTEHPRGSGIVAWLERCRARPGYAGIGTYLDDKYLSVMRARGADAEGQLRSLFAA